MSLAEKILHDIELLPKEKQVEVIDFIGYLNEKERKANDEIFRIAIEENVEVLRELAK